LATRRARCHSSRLQCTRVADGPSSSSAAWKGGGGLSAWVCRLAGGGWVGGAAPAPAPARSKRRRGRTPAAPGAGRAGAAAVPQQRVRCCGGRGCSRQPPSLTCRRPEEALQQRPAAQQRGTHAGAAAADDGVQVRGRLVAHVAVLVRPARR
jgi:hypothetical protein